MSAADSFPSDAATATLPLRRFVALDGWRGVCALMVVCLHAPVAGAFSGLAIFRHAYLFVDFFFVLSGFVMAHAFAEPLRARRHWAGFLEGRFMRLYPLHLFMLLLFLGFELAMLATRGQGGAFQGGNSVGAFFANLFLVHSLGVVDVLGWNYPSWSISAEAVAYVLFAVLVLSCGRFLSGILALLAASSLIVVYVEVGHIETHVAFGWLRCLAGFSVGALLRLWLWPRASRPDGEGTRLTWTLIEVTTVAAVSGFVIWGSSGAVSLAACLVFAAAIFVFAHERGWISRGLASPPIAFLGLISYSIYMTHAFVIDRLTNLATVLESRLSWRIFAPSADGLKQFGTDGLSQAVALLLILAVTMLFSTATWYAVERPTQKLRFSRWRAARTGKERPPEIARVRT